MVYKYVVSPWVGALRAVLEAVKNTMQRHFADAWLSRQLDSDLFDHKQIMKIFWPLLLDKFFIFLINAISTSLVSSLGPEAMAAVSMVGTIGGIATSVLFAVAMGGGVLIAQAKGSGDEDRLNTAVCQLTTLCVIAAALIATPLLLFAEPLMNMIYPKAEPLLIEYAVTYLRLMMTSMFLFSIFEGIFVSMRSVGDSRSSLILTVFINVVHLLCSILFINVLGLGVSGSGLSYITARALGCFVALYMLCRKGSHFKVRARAFFRLQGDIVKPIIRLGVPFSIEQLIFQGGMLIVSRYLNGWGGSPELGTLAVAMHGVTNSYFTLYTAPIATVNALATTICGQCIGARRLDLFRRYTSSFIRVGRVVALIVVVILTLLAPLALQMYHPDPDGLHMIWQMLLIGVLPLPLIWCDAMVPSYALKAAGDANYTTIVSMTALIIGRVILGYVFTITLDMGPVGIWVAQLVEWVYRAVLNHFRLRGTRWVKPELSK